MTSPIPGTFSSKRAEQVYIRYDSVSGLPVAMVMRMTDGSKVLYPLFQYSVVPNVLSMNPAMPVPVESFTGDVLTSLADSGYDQATMKSQITALQNAVGALQTALAGAATASAVTTLAGRVTDLETWKGTISATITGLVADMTRVKLNGTMRSGQATKTINSILGGTITTFDIVWDNVLPAGEYEITYGVKEGTGSALIGLMPEPVVSAYSATGCTVKVQTNGVLSSKVVTVWAEARHKQFAA